MRVGIGAGREAKSPAVGLGTLSGMVQAEAAVHWCVNDVTTRQRSRPVSERHIRLRAIRSSTALSAARKRRSFATNTSENPQSTLHPP